MTDKIKPEFNNQAAHEPNDACAPTENNHCAPAENNRSTPEKKYIGPAEEKDTKNKAEQEKEILKEFEKFKQEVHDILDDTTKRFNTTNNEFKSWFERSKSKLKEAHQKSIKNFKRNLLIIAAVLGGLTYQNQKETHEPELGDTKEKVTWTKSVFGIPFHRSYEVDGKPAGSEFILAETFNELVRDELPNIDKAYEPEPIKKGAWKTTRELLRDNSAQTPETSQYEWEETKDITAPQIAVPTPETSQYEWEETKDITSLQIAVATPETSEHKTEGTKDTTSLQTQALKHLKDKNSR